MSGRGGRFMLFTKFLSWSVGLEYLHDWSVSIFLPIKMQKADLVLLLVH
jgi:hypothetical protein